MQNTNHVFLVRPGQFVFNNETAASNAFQQKIVGDQETISKLATEEFDAMVQKLRKKGVDVTVFDDAVLPPKPDAVFPNNWITMHADGTVILYPMFATNRRLERRNDIIDALRLKFQVKEVVDFSCCEAEDRFLEGTGSIIFDHIAKTAYACISPRTDQSLFIEVCDFLQYQPIYFHSKDRKGMAIYHTNVMMCIAEKFTVICLDSITDDVERKNVVENLEASGHEIVDISFQQMENFAGNMLEIQASSGEKLLALSQSAYNCLTDSQRIIIQHYAELLPLPITTIETIGGGSARCMIAEIFLPIKAENYSI